MNKRDKYKMQAVAVVTGIAAALMLVMWMTGCGDSSPSGASPVPQSMTPVTPFVSMDPELIHHDAKISRSSGQYHYISWLFTIRSPREYEYGYVEIKWFDEQGFQIDWSNWSGVIKQGEHTYTDETMVKKDVWSRVKTRSVELLSWR